MNEKPLVHIAGGGVTIAEHAVLQDVNLTIGTGELVYLIGKTGSGKSSLLKCLYGERTLTQGEGTVCGHDLTNITRKNVHTLVDSQQRGCQRYPTEKSNRRYER